MSCGHGQANSIGAITRTPTFSEVFKFGQLRRCYQQREGKRQCHPPLPIPKQGVFLAKVKKSLKSKFKHSTHCCARGCLRKCSREFLLQVAEWRQAWHVTPRKPKRHALLQLARARRRNSDPKEVGAAQVAEGKQVVVQLKGVSRNHSPYPFLGLELCR